MKRCFAVVALNFTLLLSQNSFASETTTPKVTENSSSECSVQNERHGRHHGRHHRRHHRRHNRCHDDRRHTRAVNCYDAGTFANQLISAVEDLARDNCTSRDIAALANDLIVSIQNLYGILESCVSSHVDYDSILSSFDTVTADYNTLLNSSENSDISAITNSYNDLANEILRQR